jgi:hypothetical protein
MNDDEATAMAEAIKNMEPALRVKGLTPDWGKFHYQFQTGQYAEDKTMEKAIDDSAADKVNSKE